MNKREHEISFSRNNLNKASSPYLLQHASNPIWWQEWSEDLIKYAVSINKPLFVSVGYSTCHWCHVMAVEAFSDENTAKYLNMHFVSIKIDREQRPDIDQFMMDFINKQSGRGGWPLNVFLTPDLRPVFALTYAPAFSSDSMVSFQTVAEKVYEYYQNNKDKVPFFISGIDQPSVADETSLLSTLSDYYDSENGGFGTGQKFPSYSTLLYLLYQLSIDESPSLKTICTKTLDAIRLRGISDHLQGGIFRYCVDPGWTIPHFEKMLYDQAMTLWTFSLAYKVIGDIKYRRMAENALRCLDESFYDDGLYISAHDADTKHVEGTTYLWSYQELKTLLLPDEFEEFCEVYFIDTSGNFGGLNHLIRRNDKIINNTENKLLSIRNKRAQPDRDTKILSGINALVAIAMIQSSRLLDSPDTELKAITVIRNIIDRFWDGKILSHSLYKGVLQKQGFLFDAGAVLTAITLICESDTGWLTVMRDFTDYVNSFKDEERWIESQSEDFQKVYASWFDHPVPSSISLAEMGLIRSSLLNGQEISSMDYRQPFQSDFYNITAMLNNGLFHVYTSKKFISWNILPVNSVQLRGETEQDCYMGACRIINHRIVHH